MVLRVIWVVFFLVDTSSGYETDVEVNLWYGPPRNRRRRDRTQFKQRHLARLEEVFTNDRYPDIHTREELADEMGVTEDRIQVIIDTPINIPSLWYLNKKNVGFQKAYNWTESDYTEGGMIALVKKGKELFSFFSHCKKAAS